MEDDGAVKNYETEVPRVQQKPTSLKNQYFSEACVGQSTLKC
jgi:hypothetical protein